MTSTNCYSSLHPFPFDLNEDDQHQQHHLFSLESQPSSSNSSSSSLICPDFFNSTVSEPAGYHQGESQQFQDQAKNYAPPDGALESESGLKLYKWKKEDRVNESHQGVTDTSSAKWMSSKMRMMKKMMSSDHTDSSNSFTKKFKDQKKQQLASSPDNNSHSSYNNNNNNNNSSSSSTVRVCADCSTTKTPLWRSGPRGPMSLCNACGIRQRKARRAMAEAAAAANGSIVATETKPRMKSKVQHKAKRSSNGCVPRFKNKKCKNAGPQGAAPGRNKLCFEDLRIILSKSSAFHRVFPQDEKEAAILLMSLSYGLVHG